MSILRHLIGLLGTGAAIAVWMILVIVLAYTVSGAKWIVEGVIVGFFLGFLVLGIFYGWLLTAFLHYRHGRQDELLHVLASVVEADAPLAPALWAYLDDRPRGTWRETWLFLMLLFVVPGYYWFRHRQHNFDRKVARVAARLERGESLSNALHSVRGAMPRDAVLTIAVGESTGRLAQCLRGALPTRLTGVFIEAIPRVLYPLIVLLLVAVVMAFWAVVVMPRMMMLFQDFSVELPPVTRQTAEVSEWLEGYVLDGYVAFLQDYLWYLAAAGTTVCLGGTLLFSSFLWWFTPGIGRLYQMHVQGRVLNILSVLIRAEKPVPQAVALLVEAGFGSLVVRWRLRVLARQVARGEPLAKSLRRASLLPRSMAPLVQSAERLGNLGWALGELAELRTSRLIRIVCHTSALLSPLFVSLLGGLICFMALAIFVPFIKLLEELVMK